MIKFKEFKIKEICDVTSSKRIFADEYISYGVPFYRSREIIEKHDNKMELSERLFISDEKYESIKSKFGVPKHGDILLTSVGTIGVPYYVEDEKFNIVKLPKRTILVSFKLTVGIVSITSDEFTTTNEAIAHFKCSDDELEYLYFYLKNFKY